MLPLEHVAHAMYATYDDALRDARRQYDTAGWVVVAVEHGHADTVSFTYGRP